MVSRSCRCSEQIGCIFEVIPKISSKLFHQIQNRVASSAIIKLTGCSSHIIRIRNRYELSDQNNFDGVKENSYLSVSEAVRLVGAFGALSKCGNCRSLGVIAFCSSECNSCYFGGALLTESSTVVLKT